MKALKLKTVLTALGFFAVSAIFAQVDSSKSTTTTTPADSVNINSQVSPQASPMADSTTMDHNNVSNAPVSASDSTSAENKADKKWIKADKKEAKANKKGAKALEKEAKAADK